MKYSLKQGLKELESKRETSLTEDLSRVHTRDAFRPEWDKHLTE